MVTGLSVIMRCLNGFLIDYSVSDNSNVDGKVTQFCFPLLPLSMMRPNSSSGMAKTFSRFISRMVRLLRKLILMLELTHRKSTSPTM